MATGPIHVRAAEMADSDFVAQDGCISREALEDKIARGEVVVATAGARKLGYARVDFQMLPNRKRKNGGWEPSLPLVLRAWESPILFKKLRFLEHLEGPLNLIR